MLPPIKISTLHPQAKTLPSKPSNLPENAKNLLSIFFKNKVFSLLVYSLGKESTATLKNEEKNGILKEKPFLYEPKKISVFREDILHKLVKIASTRSKFKHKDKVEVWKQQYARKFLRGINFEVNIELCLDIFTYFSS